MNTTLEAVEPASLAYARRRLTCGTHVFGPEEIGQVLGGTFNLPPPPSDADIDRAFELGEYLILQTDKDADGKALTMSNFHDRFGNRLGDGKLFYGTSGYAREDFFLTDVPRPGWFFVSRDVIPDSTGLNYVGETRAMVSYLRDKVYAGTELPKVYQQDVAEFESREDELEELIIKDWKKGAIECSSLKMNQRFREKPVEVVNGIVMYRTINGRYPLTGMYTRTAQRSSDGYLVAVGHADAEGVLVYGGRPGRSSSDLGVRFFRSAVPNLES